MPASQSSRYPDKRQQIVETAYRLFKRHGFHATGIDRIIADAGVAKMTMYRNFPSKDRLIVEVLDQRFQRFERQLDAMTAAERGPEEKIEAILDWYGRWFERTDFCGCLFAHALAEYSEPDHPVHETAARQKDKLRRRLREILSKVLSAEEAETSSMAILMLIEGATLAAGMGQGGEAIRAARKAAFEIVDAGRRQ